MPFWSQTSGISRRRFLGRAFGGLALFALIGPKGWADEPASAAADSSADGPPFITRVTRPFDAETPVGGDQGRPIAFGDFGQSLLDALNINGHGIHRAGNEYGLG